MEISLLKQMGFSAVVIGQIACDRIRIKPDGLIIVRDGLVQFPLFLSGEASVVPCKMGAGFYLYGSGKVHFRTRVVTTMVVDVTAVDVGSGVVGIGFHCTGIIIEGGRELSNLGPCGTSHVEGKGGILQVAGKGVTGKDI